jgi:hypothetical protein
MDKNYYELVEKAAFEGNWLDVITLANEAIRDTDETFFGFRKGVFNVISGYSKYYESEDDKKLRAALQSVKIHLIVVRDGTALNKMLKNKEITLDLCSKYEYVVILTSKDDIAGKLNEKSLPSIHYKKSYTKKYGNAMKSMLTNKIYKINENSLTALRRDANIDSIFED